MLDPNAQASELSKAGMGCLQEVVSLHHRRGQAETDPLGHCVGDGSSLAG